jgi:hypothetical protein
MENYKLNSRLESYFFDLVLYDRNIFIDIRINVKICIRREGGLDSYGTDSQSLAGGDAPCKVHTIV